MNGTESAGDTNIGCVFGIMIVMGVLGGAINHFLMRDDEDAGRSKFSSRAGRTFFIGIGASFLIPLFLNTISSRLLDDALTGDPTGRNRFVLASFCLLAAITSRAFISTLASRILKQAEEAKEQATKAVQQTEALADSVAEPAEPAEKGESADAHAPRSSVPAAAMAEELVKASAEELRVLQAIENSKFPLRSTWGISQDLRKAPDEAKSELLALARKGWVNQVDGKKGPRWILTAAGRAQIRK